MTMAYSDSKLYKRMYQRVRRSGGSRKKAKACAKSAVYRSRRRPKEWMW